MVAAFKKTRGALVFVPFTMLITMLPTPLEAQRPENNGKVQEAREEALHAIALARTDTQGDVDLGRVVEETHDTRTLKDLTDQKFSLLKRLIDKARGRVRDQGDERARKQLAAAERELKSAKNLLTNGRYREAKQALEACEKTLRNSVRLLPPVPPTDPANRLGETYRLLIRAQEIVSSRGEPADPNASEAIEEGRLLLREAQRAIGSGCTDDGMKLIERARGMLRSAAREEMATLTRERVEREMAAVEAGREETANLADKCPAPGIKELIGRADEHIRLAQEYIDAARLDSAWAEIAIARNIYKGISDLCAR